MSSRNNRSQQGKCERADEDVESRRVVLALGAVVLVAVPLTVVLAGSGQAFANFGLAKRVVLPAAYLIFAAALLCPSQRRPLRRVPHVPVWVWIGPIGALVGTVGLLVSPQSPVTPSTLAQGAALLGGFWIFACVGGRADFSDAIDRKRLLVVLLGGALVAALLGGLSLTPFMALVVPSAFSALYLGIRGGYGAKRRRQLLLLALVLGILGYRALHSSAAIPISDAILAQIGACAAIVVVAFLPRAVRAGVTFAASAYVGYWLLNSGALALVGGTLHSDDVTVAQRAYEAARVLELVKSSIFTLIFGGSPGATVDLTFSPDAPTLLASGRAIGAVDDVHLLPVYMLLKVGILGVLWLAAILLTTWQAYRRIIFGLCDPWELSLLLYVVAGIAMAVPAATHLLVNPLVPLLLGILWRRGVLGRAQPSSPVPAGWRSSPTATNFKA